MIKLYVFLGSPRAFNVMAVANHLGIEYQTQALNPAKGEHLAPAYATILNDHLKGHDCVVRNSLTLADFAIGPWLNFAERASYPIASYGEIKRWHAAFIQLPACQKALAAIPR